MELVRGNPGLGAYACVVYNEELDVLLKAIVGYEEEIGEYNREHTTNNRMEIKGLIAALELATFRYKNDECIIYCDSAYCVNIFNSWINNWASNNWINSSKEQIKNLDLVKKLYEYKQIEFPNFKVVKIPGHRGEIGNELADAYARRAVYGNSPKLDKIIQKYEIPLI